MIPTTDNRPDWSLYYRDTYMEVAGLGPKYIRFGAVGNDDDNPRQFYYFDENGNPKIVKHNKLRLWWPRPGAYNCKFGAFFAEKRAVRSMKKSATYQHYTYGYLSNEAIATCEILQMIAESTPYYDINELEAAFASGKISAGAISPTMIIVKNRQSRVLMFRNMKVGTLIKGKFSCNPGFKDTAIENRVNVHLRKEGIIQ